MPGLAGAMDRRNAVAEAVGVGVHQAAIGRYWFAGTRGKDAVVFDAFDGLTLKDGFDLDWVRRRMQRSWKTRGDTGFWQFDRQEYDVQYVLPDRFLGMV